MWNTLTPDLHAGLRSVVPTLFRLAQESPFTMGVAAVVGFVASMFAAAIVVSGATAVRVDEAPPIRLKRCG